MMPAFNIIFKNIVSFTFFIRFFIDNWTYVAIPFDSFKQTARWLWKLEILECVSSSLE